MERERERYALVGVSKDIKMFNQLQNGQKILRPERAGFPSIVYHHRSLLYRRLIFAYHNAYIVSGRRWLCPQ